MSYHHFNSYHETAEKFEARRGATRKGHEPVIPAHRSRDYLGIRTPAILRHTRFLPISTLRNREFMGDVSILPAHRHDAY